MEHEILFSAPIFHTGLNSTVRAGDKWMKVSVGDTLIIKEACKAQIVARGVVLGKAFLPFGLIPASWVAYQHDPACRTLPKLFDKMRELYPEFAGNSLVTVLLFDPVCLTFCPTLR
jgi:hypothetical protein